jgi:hypothetical protein
MEQPKPLTLIGIKPNPSYFHNTMRMVVIFLVILVLIMLYYSDRRSSAKNKPASISDIDSIVHPGSKMYDMIMDMNEDERTVYITSIRKTIDDANNNVSKMRLIFKSVISTLLVGFIADYVVHGNVSKVMSTTGRTGLSAALTVLT